jgi:MFS family permease
MVMFVQLGNPVGIIIGYGIAMACDLIIPNDSNYSGWRIAFGFEGVILVVCAVIILFFNKKYFSEKFVLLDDNLGREEIKEEEGKKKLINFNNIKKILCNKLFLFTTLSNSISFFGMGVVQYWGDKYMELILKMEANLRFIIFAVLCLLGPILGMIFGGLICSKLGGYGTRKAMIFVIIILIISSIISSLITIDDNMVIFIIFTWSYLFFLCAPISPESGIIISSLDNHLRGDGFALSNSLLNLLGSFPSSYVFGSLSDLYKSKLSKEDVENNKHFVYAWTTCMAYNYVGVILIIIAGVFRFKIKGDLTSNPEEEIDKIENIGIRSNTLPDPEAKDTVSEE